MPPALTHNQKTVLSKYENALRSACKVGDLTAAEGAIKKIQAAFLNNRSHFRVLRAKLWYYEAILDSGNTNSALIGFESIYVRANSGTRIHLECSAFMGICHLRLKDVDKAKNHIQFVVKNTNKITSTLKRQQFQQRLIGRIEEECILSELIGTEGASLNVEEIHQKSIELVQKSDSEILEAIADSLPSSTPKLICEVSRYSIGLMPPSDQKCLPSPESNIPKTQLGRKAIAALKRIGWRTFCDERSEVYKLWSNGISYVFDRGYFASSIVTTLAEWKIGIPQIAVGIAATAMKFGCQEFCSQFKPEGLMIPQNDRE